MFEWDDILESGEYKDLTVYEIFLDNPFYLWFIEKHKGVVFTDEISATISTRIMIEEMFVNVEEEDHGQGTLEFVEEGSARSLGEQVRDMWQSEPDPDRVPSYNTSGEEVDTLGLEERSGTLWE